MAGPTVARSGEVLVRLGRRHVPPPGDRRQPNPRILTVQPGAHPDEYVAVVHPTNRLRARVVVPPARPCRGRSLLMASRRQIFATLSPTRGDSLSGSSRRVLTLVLRGSGGTRPTHSFV
jgi:hypothetical protein